MEGEPASDLSTTASWFNLSISALFWVNDGSWMPDVTGNVCWGWSAEVGTLSERGKRGYMGMAPRGYLIIFCYYKKYKRNNYCKFQLLVATVA
jgi:hypothetical protein